MAGFARGAWRWVAVAFGLAASLVLVSCGNAGGSGAAEVSPEAWKIELRRGAAALTLPLEMLNVYLVESEDAPEYFEIEGPGTFLCGEIPLEAAVGYAEDWQALFGRRIELGEGPSRLDGSREPSVELPNGLRASVRGGTLVFEKLSGKYSGSEGDLTLTGRIELDVETDEGSESWSGTIAVHCVTWG